MLNKLQDQYFGNYRGQVLEHGLNGLCKIFIPGVYPEEFKQNKSKLPWAEPCQPLFAGGAIGNGTFEYPDINSTVWLFFEGGNINYPVFFGLSNNDKNKFISGEFIIHYDKSTIKFDKSNHITITAEQYYPSASGDYTNSFTGSGNGLGIITLNADTIRMNSRLLDVNTKTIEMSAWNNIKFETSAYTLTSNSYTHNNTTSMRTSTDSMNISGNTTDFTNTISLSSKAPINILSTNNYDTDSLTVGAISTGATAYKGSKFNGSLYINNYTITNYSMNYPTFFTTRTNYDITLDAPINLNKHFHPEFTWDTGTVTRENYTTGPISSGHNALITLPTLSYIP